MRLAHPGAADGESRGPSAFGPIGQVVIAAIVGILVLPATIGALARRGGGLSPAEILWLGGAVLASAWILALAPRLAALLRQHLASLPGASPTARRLSEGSRPFLLAALLVALIDTALVEATLRPPLHQALAADTVVASLFFVLFLGLALRLYLAASPWIEVGARAALDALVPTTVSDAGARFAAVDDRRPRATTTRRAESARPIETLPPTELAPTHSRDTSPTDLAPTRAMETSPEASEPRVPRDSGATPAAPTRLPPTNLQFRSSPRRSADAMLLDILAETRPRPMPPPFDPIRTAPDGVDRTSEI